MEQEEEKRFGPYKHALWQEVEALKSILPVNQKRDYSNPITIPEHVMRHALYVSLVVEKYETVLWGKPRNSVREVIEKFAPLVKAFDEERAEKKRKREEEIARSKAESKARLREREEARKRPAVKPESAPERAPVLSPMVAWPPQDGKPKTVEIPWIDANPDKVVVEPKIPPDDGTALYQWKLERFKQTGRWEPAPWERPGYR